jgi:transcriptional regulator with XRE-family HTH domain
MPTRHPNHRLVKIHRNYTVEEIATRLGVHRNTVREWIKRGLQTIDKKRPMLILGHTLASFLLERRKKNKRPCQPGEIYCVKCRKPQTPAEDMVDYQAITETQGNLIGLCPSCGVLIYRRINPTKLEQVCGKLIVTIPQARRHIDEREEPSVNSDLRQGESNHAKTQSQ